MRVIAFTKEIHGIAKSVYEMIDLWERAVEKGWINGEEGWEERGCAETLSLRGWEVRDIV